SGVNPLASTSLGEAPRASRVLSATKLDFNTATRSGVRPSLVRKSISAPPLTMATMSCCSVPLDCGWAEAANERGVSPLDSSTKLGSQLTRALATLSRLPFWIELNRRERLRFFRVVLAVGKE